MGFATENAKVRDIYVDEDTGASMWWLRSPGISRYNPAYVSIGGSVYAYGHRVDYGDVGVRPALWVKLESSRQ